MVLEDPPTPGTDTNLYLAYFHHGPTPICKQTGLQIVGNVEILLKCWNFDCHIDRISVCEADVEISIKNIVIVSGVGGRY